MKLGLIFTSIVLETHAPDTILITSITAGVFFLTTLVGIENLEETVLTKPFNKLKGEINRLREMLESKNKQLAKANAIIERQGDLLKQHGIGSSSNQEKVKRFEKLLNSVLLTENDWSDFRKVFDKLHYGFLPRLKLRHPDLTEGEKRLAVLIKLRLSNKEMARMLGISPNSIVKSRYRLKKKLCPDKEDKSLENYVKGI